MKTSVRRSHFRRISCFRGERGESMPSGMTGKTEVSGTVPKLIDRLNIWIRRVPVGVRGGSRT